MPITADLHFVVFEARCPQVDRATPATLMHELAGRHGNEDVVEFNGHVLRNQERPLSERRKNSEASNLMNRPGDEPLAMNG